MCFIPISFDFFLGFSAYEAGTSLEPLIKCCNIWVHDKFPASDSVLMGMQSGLLAAAEMN